MKKGKIIEHIIYLALPMLFLNLMQNGLSIYDMFLLGKLGVQPQSAVTIALFITNFFWVIEGGLVAGCTAMAARYAGMRDHEKLKAAVVNMIAVGYVFGLIYAVIVYFSMDSIIRVFTTNAVTFELSRTYLKTILFSIVNDSGLFVFFTALRAAGYIRKHFVMFLIAVAANIVLEPLLVLGLAGFPQLGVSGVALARLFAYLIASGIMVWVFLTDKGVLRINIREIKVDPSIILNYLKISLPAAGQGFLGATGNILLLKLYSGYGDAFIAGTAIGGRLDVFLMNIGWAISSATAIMVGHNMGAGNVKRAGESAMESLRFYTYFTLAATILYFCFAGPIAGIFSKDATVLRYAALYMKIVAPFYLLMGVGLIMSAALNGAGATKSPMLINIIGFFVVQIPLAFILTRFTPVKETGIFISIGVTMFFQGITAWIIYAIGKWKLKKI